MGSNALCCISASAINTHQKRELQYLSNKNQKNQGKGMEGKERPKTYIKK